MKPEERESQRYAEKDFCTISKEEKLMMNLLLEYRSKIKSEDIPLKILDIGCGSGRIGKILQNAGYQVTGLDFADEAVKKAIANGINAKRANLDEGIPESDSMYDVVWAGDIIEHVFDPIGLLRECFRVLKKGGVILITIPSDVGLVSRIKMLFGVSHQEQMYMTSGFYKHHTFFTPRLIRFMLAKANLHIEKFLTILILGKSHYRVPGFSSAFFNEMIIQAKKI